MASKAPVTSRKEYYAHRYAENKELVRLRTAVSYYRRKKAKGEEWKPKEFTKLSIWCQEHGLDVIAVIEGTQALTIAP